LYASINASIKIYTARSEYGTFFRLSRVKRGSINKAYPTLNGYYKKDFQLNRNIKNEYVSNTVSKIEECSINENSNLYQNLFDIRN
jgi:hypothetical protein